MRLAVIFLTVLALSAIVTSMAAWGISYGTSYYRVSTMAAQFSTLSQSSLAAFGSFVHTMLNDNSALVGAILDTQKASGYNRTEQVKESMVQTMDVLVNYTANVSGRFQEQMDGVMGMFDGLMDAVVAQFKDLATGYVAQIRR
eukprot:EG_transcript_43260